MGRFEVTTISGDITLDQVDASGGVHVESSSGDIHVQLSVGGDENWMLAVRFRASDQAN